MKIGLIGIVIVNYNGEKYQNDALRTIYASSYQNFEVIVVDSASKDRSIEIAKKEYPQVHYLLQSENVGVAKGNNIGIRYAIERKRCINRIFFRAFIFDILVSSSLSKWRFCFERRN